MTKSSPITIAPSLLAANMLHLGEEVSTMVEAGADWFHLDVMDGSFVPPITFGTNLVEACSSQTTLPLDVHLMIQNPESHLESFAKAGASTITVHAECCPHLYRTLQTIKEHGVSAGVAINPGTPAEVLFPILEVADLILVMSVNPGWGGQAFIPSSLTKIEALANSIESHGYSAVIEVDGGVNATTGRQCVDAGASVLVAGSYLFGATDRRAAIESLRQP